MNFGLVIRSWITLKDDEDQIHDNPSVSVIVPVYNEEVNILDSIKSIVEQTYKNYNIIIVNDGSTDKTLRKLINQYGLFRVTATKHKDNNNFKDITNIYSNTDCKIILIDKPNGGKADALNAGFAYSNAKYILSVDGDTLLDKKCLQTILDKKKPESDAVASMVGISNDNKIINNEVVEPRIPKNFWAKVQWMEYNKSYMLLRNSLKDKNCITVIPGACSFISSEYITKTGGYKHNHLGEDMEHTLNLLDKGAKIQFISKVLSWTEAPDNLKDLGKQRVRWFRGAFQSYTQYTKLIFSNKNKFLGFFFLPYIWLFDIIGCWIEVVGLVIGIKTMITQPNYDYTNFLILWFIIVTLHYINFLTSLLIIKKKLKLCKSYRTVLFTTAIEGFTYHYLYVYWIIKAHLMEIFRFKRSWNKIERKGF